MRNSKQARYVLCAVFAGSLLPMLAHAQEPSGSFEDLLANRRLSSGNFIRLVDRSGSVISGRIESISADVVRMRVRDNLREIPEASVQTIQRQRPADPTWEGTLIGLGVGLGTGVALAAGNCTLPDDECLAITTAVFVPTLAGGGAALGWLIDRGIRGYDTVFEASPLARSRGLNIAPVLSTSRRGVQVSFSF